MFWPPRSSSTPALLLLLALCTGCGYKLVRYEQAGADAPRLYVRTLENDTPEPRVELVFSEALRREVLRRGGLRLVSEASAGDFLVSGRVVGIDTSGRSFSSTVLALEYTIRLALDLHIQRRDGSSVPLDPHSLSNSEVYLTSPDVEAGRKNRGESLRRVCDVLAVRVVDALHQVAFP